MFLSYPPNAAFHILQAQADHWKKEVIKRLGDFRDTDLAEAEMNRMECNKQGDAGNGRQIATTMERQGK